MKISAVFRRIAADFSLSSVSPVYFLRSEWELEPEPAENPALSVKSVSWPYFAYRLAFMSYFVSSTVSNMICGANTGSEGLSFYFLFLTNWTYAMQLIYAVIQYVNVVWSKFCRSSPSMGKGNNDENSTATAGDVAVTAGGSLSVLEKCIWIFFNVVNVIPYGVTIIYWVFLFDSDTDWQNPTCARVHNYFVHALNSVVALLDAFIVGIPVRISHMVFPVFYGFLYMLFSILYEVWNSQYSGTSEYIYEILDWKNSPGSSAITCALGLVVIALAHLGLNWGVYQLRHWLRTKRCGGKAIFTL